MSFKVFCDIKENGKKCGREMEPVIDKKTGELYCECGQKLVNQDCLTRFAKAQLVSLGRVKRNEQRKQAFSVKCAECEKESPPVVENNKLICSYCNAEFKNLSAPFAQMLKQTLKLQNRKV